MQPKPEKSAKYDIWIIYSANFGHIPYWCMNTYLSFYCTFLLSLYLRLSLTFSIIISLAISIFHNIFISLPITTIKINSIRRGAPNDSARVLFWKQNLFLANTEWKRNFIFYRKTHVQTTNKPRSPRSETIVPNIFHIHGAPWLSSCTAFNLNFERTSQEVISVPDF